MKYCNNEIPYMWSRGRQADSHTGNFWTNGRELYSYQLCIGETMPDGKKLLHDYTAGGIEYYSQTTSCHVGKSVGDADYIRDAKEIRKIK
mgnify:FL=1